MKANRKFVQADEAVSPVIAVILMVAITVVLAATVFVLVSDIGGNTGSSAPAISWGPDESADRMVVNTAAQNADWNRLTIQVDSCAFGGGTTAGSSINIGAADASPYFNEAGAVHDATNDLATTCGTVIVKEITGTAAKINAGDFLHICQGPVLASNPATNVKITIKDTTANALVTSHTFTNVGNCAT